MEALMKSDAGAKLVRATSTPGLTANILNTTVGAADSMLELFARPAGFLPHVRLHRTDGIEVFRGKREDVFDTIRPSNGLRVRCTAAADLDIGHLTNAKPRENRGVRVVGRG